MYERPWLKCTIYTDAMNGCHKSLDGNKHTQVFATEQFFGPSYLMESKSMSGQALKEFISDFSVPDCITCDGASEQVRKRTEFMAQAQKHHIHLSLSEPGMHNQSKVEQVICELRKKWFHIMHKKHVPKQLWDYGLRWTWDVMLHTSTEARSAKGQTPLEIITGDTPDISEVLDFGFHNWCWYSDAFGMAETKLGRWLGVSHRVGNLMSYWLLTDKCKVILRTMVKRVTNLEMQEDMNKGRTQAFDQAICECINDSTHYIIDSDKNEPKDWATHLLDTDDDFQDEFNNVISHPEVKETDESFTPEVMGDTYVNMELALPQGDTLEPRHTRVTKRLRDANGIPIGTAHDTSILDTRMYGVEFMDGEKSSLSANYIAENLFVQIDDDGNRQVLLNEIIDHCTT